MAFAAASGKPYLRTGRSSPGGTARNVGAAVVAAVIAIAALGMLVRGWWRADVPPLRLHVTFPAGQPGANEPLITTGKSNDGDFLTVKYVTPDKGILTYDAWGAGGPVSEPFPLHAGEARLLEIQMPALATAWHPAGVPLRRLRVTLDGRAMLDADVQFHHRGPGEVYIGEDPIGGSPANVFRGQITNGRGAPLRGSLSEVYTVGERRDWLLRHHRWGLLIGVVLIALVSLGAGRVARSLRLSRRSPGTHSGMRRTDLLLHGTFVIVALVCAWMFANIETGGTFRLTYPVSFGNFFDYQAASLLEGHLDVPEGAIGGEAFIVHGKYYGYFGITPALLRVPLVQADVAFGEVSRWYMLAYFVAALVAAYALLRYAVRLLGGSEAAPSHAAVVLFTVTAGVGSTLFYLGCRAYIYHEADLCGATFALWSAYCSLRYLAEPTRRWWLGAAVCGLLSVHARPPSGLFALFLLGCVAFHHLVHGFRRHGFRAVWAPGSVGLAALVAVLSFNGLSYLKFGTFDGSPLKYSVQFKPERLAHIEGKNFHFVNLRHNVDAYVLALNFHIDPHFPYFFFDPRHARSYPEAKIDIAEPIVAMPWAMPALVGLTLFGSGWILLGVPRLRWGVILLWFGVTPMALALFTAIATAHRHTADFCPFLIASSACGLAALDATRWRRLWLALLAILAIASMYASIALSLQYQGDLVWGVPSETIQRYHALQTRVNHWFGSKQP